VDDFDDEVSKIDVFSSVSVVITPHDKGFSCGILDPKSPEERDICSYIAKGIVRFVTTNADIVYEEGMQGFYEDDLEPLSQTVEEHDGNVIDLFNYKKGDLN
tara:strand:- start:3083 stop:3388 length:306 start_codon:yes stop_codon:yes gene_type:complete